MEVVSDLLSTRMAARLLNVSPGHVRRLAARGELAHESTPLGRLFALVDLKQRLDNPPRRGRPPRAGGAPSSGRDPAPRQVSRLVESPPVASPVPQVPQVPPGCVRLEVVELCSVVDHARRCVLAEFHPGVRDVPEGWAPMLIQSGHAVAVVE